MGAGRLHRQGFPGVAADVAIGAERTCQLAMHVDELARTGPLVKVVDILRHQQEIARPFAFETACEDSTDRGAI